MSHGEWWNSHSGSETDHWCSMSVKAGGQTLWRRKCVVIVFAFFFYLLTLLQIHKSSIVANAVEETQAETFPTQGVFTQLACAPIYSHTDSTVTTEITPAPGGEWPPAGQVIPPETLYWWLKQVLFRTQGSDWTRSGQGGSCGDAGSRRICLVLFLDVW